MFFLFTEYGSLLGIQILPVELQNKIDLKFINRKAKNYSISQTERVVIVNIYLLFQQQEKCHNVMHDVIVILLK